LACICERIPLQGRRGSNSFKTANGSLIHLCLKAFPGLSLFSAAIMKRISPILCAAVVSFGLVFVIARANETSYRISLPTSKTLTVPVPGFIARTNSYPATIALSPDGRYAAFLNQGYGTQESGVRQSIAILDLSNNQLRDFPDDRLRGDEKSTLQSYFIGLGFSTDGRHIYASMGSAAQNGIAVYTFADGQVAPERFITIPAQRMAPGKTVTLDSGNNPAGTASAYPAGFAVLRSTKGDRLLIANNLSDNVVLLDVTSGRILNSFDVSTSKYIPAAYPYTVVANRAGTKAWVSLWNDSAVAELDLRTKKVTRRIELWRPSDPVAPGTHPTAMLLNRSEDILYVAMANAGTTQADGVAVVDLKRGVLRGCYRVALAGNSEPGAASIAIALSADEKHLYAAVASLNAVAVFETKPFDQTSDTGVVESPVGFIPTEWYPSALAFAGNDLLIASAKGESSGPNNMKAVVQTGLHPNPHPYIATLIGGAIQRLSLSEIDANLAAYTRLVEDNNLVHAAPEKIEFASGQNPIRHVIYILKENRTYDQILGDLGAGDGDPSLTMYGAEITPNEHKLALQFGVLDNFYDSGDVSANGHLWSDASATSDYIEKIWPIIYRGSERPQDQGNNLDQGLPLMDDPGTGFLWDNLAKHNFTYRVYGEMVDSAWCRDEKVTSPREGTPSPLSAACPSAEIKPGEPLPASASNPNGGPSPWPWAIPRLRSVHPTKEAQRGHIDPLYADFAIDYPDQLRADEFLREFDEFVKARGSAKELPQFIQLWLPNDHTGGTRVGKPAPRASVADNDLAVGRVVDAVSHSPYWDDTAIFVVEDDAQDGADHVDAHRSTAMVISKYSPRSETPFIDHHFYTTAGMVHTMEDLLGLPPMNLFDAHAPLMVPLFAGPGTQPPYRADDKNLRSGLLYEMNDKKAPGAKQSAKMDFSRPDAVNAQELNAILWQDAKGAQAFSGQK
jgi:DNA-binding beta-propeller fold protein YncE